MILVQDSAIAPNDIESARQSALQSGFGAWTPASALFGSGTYGGMNWKGHHGTMVVALRRAIQREVIPNSMFFRVLLETEEKRLIHSDQFDGNYTAIAYLSNHDEPSGTAFYRHKETGLYTMPTIQEMIANGSTDYWKVQSETDDAWEQVDYVDGRLGRILVFSAAFFHGRVPNKGIGKTPAEGRMIWVSHFYTPEDLA